MGEKTLARRTMIEAGVPVVPGTETAVTNLEEAEKQANEIGFPLMIKAAAGGGGKGMRRVFKAEEVRAAIETSQREAQAAFGDNSVYIERFIERPRHIEVQIFGDQHGNIVHLNERECSIQRRHQKVIEEAPSSFVDPKVRAAIGEVAVKAAKAVNYVGAGTVELLMDENKDFYFLEMNTRLQVEHPVTELTTGLDLVREQIRIAAGEKLSFTGSIQPRGHAIEARIYAEDPNRGFMPSPGKLSHLRQPGGYGVRIDSGVYAGYEITPHYDPMISKLIVWGSTRQEAIQRMDRALSEFVVNGVTTNVTYLRKIVQHEAFIRGDTQTDFIEKYLDQGGSAPSQEHVDVVMIAAAIRQYEYGRELANRIVQGSGGDTNQPSQWAKNGRLQSLRGADL